MLKFLKCAARPCAAVALLCLTAAAPAAAGENAGKSPWGPDDEIGRLNMMTEASRHDALRRIAGGRVYDLGVDLFVGMPDCCSAAFGDPAYQFWMTHVPARGGDALLSHSSDAVSMNTHTAPISTRSATSACTGISGTASAPTRRWGRAAGPNRARRSIRRSSPGAS